MKKQMNIYGVDFEIGKAINHEPDVSTRDLDDCYGRPSDIKRNIWNWWLSWFVNKCGSVNFGVCSASSSFFSIEGKIEFEGKKYYLYITKAHNRAYEIVA